MFSAVKKLALKIPMPMNRYDTEKNRKACMVSCTSLSSPRKKSSETGLANASESTVIAMDASPIIIRLLFRRFFSSS